MKISKSVSLLLSQLFTATLSLTSVERLLADSIKNDLSELETINDHSAISKFIIENQNRLSPKTIGLLKTLLPISNEILSIEGKINAIDSQNLTDALEIKFLNNSVSFKKLFPGCPVCHARSADPDVAGGDDDEEIVNPYSTIIKYDHGSENLYLYDGDDIYIYVGHDVK